MLGRSRSLHDASPIPGGHPPTASDIILIVSVLIDYNTLSCVCEVAETRFWSSSARTPPGPWLEPGRTCGQVQTPLDLHWRYRAGRTKSYPRGDRFLGEGPTSENSGSVSSLAKVTFRQDFYFPLWDLVAAISCDFHRHRHDSALPQSGVRP